MAKNIYRVIQAYGTQLIRYPKVLESDFQLYDIDKLISEMFFDNVFLSGSYTTIVNEKTRCVTYKGFVFIIETVKEGE